MDKHFHPRTNQVADKIREYLFGQTLVPGACLPPERELSQKFELSRLTLRKILADFEAEGLITRIPNKGTFFSLERVPQNVSRLTSFTQDMQRRNMVSNSIILKAGKFKANPSLCDKLGIAPTEGVFLLRRLRLANKLPMAIEDCFLPEKLAEQIKPEIQDDFSLYKTLQTQLGIFPAKATQIIEVCTLNAEERKLLGKICPPAALFIRRTSGDKNGTIFEYVESKYRGDRYFLTMDLTQE
ncbi:MAG: GntR family transcriptional regulator [Anaerolineaceae bacterium]|nr:GntR family transcriptional regulator [Anaerolineaceae bacterium]